MRTLATMLLVVLLAFAGPCAAAADQPAGQPQEKQGKKAQQTKDKSQGGAQRKRSVPET